VDENSDPLLFWKRCYLLGSALEPLRPLAASIAAVPATQAICETLFRSGGQMLPACTHAHTHARAYTHTTSQTPHTHILPGAHPEIRPSPPVHPLLPRLHSAPAPPPGAYRTREATGVRAGRGASLDSGRSRVFSWEMPSMGGWETLLVF
jgi:hypothetical protein